MVFEKMHVIKCVLLLQTAFLFWELLFLSYDIMGADTVGLCLYLTGGSLTLTFIPKQTWLQEKKKKGKGDNALTERLKKKKSLGLQQQMSPNLHLFPVTAGVQEWVQFCGELLTRLCLPQTLAKPQSRSGFTAPKLFGLSPRIVEERVYSISLDWTIYHTKVEPACLSFICGFWRKTTFVTGFVCTNQHLEHSFRVHRAGGSISTFVALLHAVLKRNHCALLS